MILFIILSITQFIFFVALLIFFWILFSKQHREILILYSQDTEQRKSLNALDKRTEKFEGKFTLTNEYVNALLVQQRKQEKTIHFLVEAYLDLLSPFARENAQKKLDDLLGRLV
jgi:hypothetical protein